MVMEFYRETIKNAPPRINIPKEFRNRNVELIILPLDEGDELKDLDENGYPIGFFEETAGSLPDFPEREPQPPFETRERID
jgi:hypothetical protein